MKRLLLISQVYVPDPAAVGQYLAEAAEALAERGWEVIVLSADRGYDDPSQRFHSREQSGGVSVRRLPASSFGKASIAHRLAAQLSFCVQSFLRGLFTSRLEAVLVSTSPPMIGIVGWALARLRGKPVVYWAMDINPDQAVVLGQMKPGAPFVRLLEWSNRRILSRASEVIALDRYMAETLSRKISDREQPVRVVPIWPMEGHLERVEHADNPFRREHGLEGKFVVMYSGNHSLAHPLDTLLEAAWQLRDDPRLVFLFIGGGAGKQAVDALIAERCPANIRSLPYQPLDQIKYSLSAADVHVVSMGNPMVGLVHPCKFYGAMALAKPVLLLGPAACHIGEVVQEHGCGWVVDHGDTDEAVRLLTSLPDLPAETLEEMGTAGRRLVEGAYGKAALVERFCDLFQP